MPYRKWAVQTRTATLPKISEAQFARILKEYDQVNVQMHRAETNTEPVEQLVEVDLRKRRLRLKDEIAKYLAQA